MLTIQNTRAAALQLTDAILLDQSIIPIFDLDGVVIDATHRQAIHPDGSLNLEMYRKLSTAANIAKDQVMPLAEVPQFLTDAGRSFFVCTARVMCKNSEKWLRKNGIKPTAVFSREGENDRRKDFELKEYHLTRAFSSLELSRSFLVDDNLANCQMAQRLNMKAIHVPFHGH